MKKPLLLTYVIPGLLLLAGLTTPLRAVLLATDSFDYPVGEQIKGKASADSGFTAPWVVQGGDTLYMVVSGLSYSATGYANGVGAATSVGNYRLSRVWNATGIFTQGNVIWTTVLFQAPQAALPDGAAAATDVGQQDVARLRVGGSGSSKRGFGFQAGLDAASLPIIRASFSDNATLGREMSIAVDQPQLLVLRLTVGDPAVDADDALTLWVNPTNLTSLAQLDATAADHDTLVGQFVPEADPLKADVYFRHFNANQPFVVDEIRVGTGLAEVALNVLNPGAPPAITTDPTAVTEFVGNNVSFTVAASGEDLTYQWRKGEIDLVDGDRISGATTATLQINAIVTGDAGDYTVVVTNAFGTATAAPATLTVTELATPAAITAQPVAREVQPGASANFTVTATGTEPLTYRWRKDGVDLADGEKYTGTASATLTVLAITHADAGAYTVVVDNAAVQPVESQPANLTVLASLSSEMAQADRLGGSAQVDLLVAANTAWTVENTLDWVTVEPASGTGPGQVTVSFAPLAGHYPRTGTVMVGGLPLSVQQRGAARLLLLEPFDYPVSEELLGKDGGFGWSTPFQGTRSGGAHLLAEGLTYEGWDTSGQSVQILGNQQTRGFDGTGLNVKTQPIWFSYLFNTARGNGGHRMVFFSQGPNGSSNKGVSVDLSYADPATDPNLPPDMEPEDQILTRILQTYGTRVRFEAGLTHLVIGRISWQAQFGIMDKISIWVDPADWSTPENLGTPTSEVAEASGAIFDATSAIYFRGAGTTQPLLVDELRVGLDLASVTPPRSFFSCLTDLEAGFRWYEGIGFLYEGYFPYVYVYAAANWLYVFADGAAEETGFYLYDFGRSQFGWSGCDYYPEYLAVPVGDPPQRVHWATAP